MVKPNKYKIILASGSPRRQQFFKDMNLDFEIRLKEIDEKYPIHLKGAKITNFLSELKANAFKNELSDDELLITSDTLVMLGDEVLGKPKDYEDAFKMLKKLSNKTHKVITSVCFKTNQKTTLLSDTTRVTFKELKEESIRYYLDNYKPFDKAGSYGIQDWIGLVGISKIQGSYSNVVGLPTEKVFAFLNDFYL